MKIFLSLLLIFNISFNNVDITILIYHLVMGVLYTSNSESKHLSLLTDSWNMSFRSQNVIYYPSAN